jgi:D-inositol-3-phosphate glycosyltransferase
VAVEYARGAEGFAMGALGTLEAMPHAGPQAVAVISVHASPLSDLGSGENGGMNLAIRRLCEGLSHRGVPTDDFVRRDGPGPDEELIAPLSRLVRLPVGPATALPKDRVVSLLDEFTDATIRHADSERRAYRAIHGHYWHGGVVGRQLRTAWGIAWVQSFHTLALTKARAGLPLDAPRAQTEGELAARADRLVAASVAEARDLIRLYHASRDRICVAQPGVDPRLFGAHDGPALRRTLGIGTGARVALFAGRLEPLKGAQVLLDAAARLRAGQEFADLVVVIAGDDSGDGAQDHRGGERRRLERHAARIGLGEHVRFVGAVPHEQLADYYAMAGVCVVPSLTESFGLVALEAQALGTPVVAASVGGLREIVEDGVTGFLVEGHEPADYARAIAAVLKDPGRKNEMGEEARLRAGRFTWHRAVERVAAIYDRLSAGGQLSGSPCGYEDEEAVALMSGAAS